MYNIKDLTHLQWTHSIILRLFINISRFPLMYLKIMCIRRYLSNHRFKCLKLSCPKNCQASTAMAWVVDPDITKCLFRTLQNQMKTIWSTVLENNQCHFLEKIFYVFLPPVNITETFSEIPNFITIYKINTWKKNNKTYLSIWTRI